MAKWLGMPVPHQKVALDELQSLDIHEIVEHKARQAYTVIGKPVLVEDSALVFHALGKLPGPYIKWFLEELSLERICQLLRDDDNRSATVTVSFCWFDGVTIQFFDGALDGRISAEPRGVGGFGFDPIFIPDGSEHTYAEMGDEEINRYSIRVVKLFPQLRDFLQSLDKQAK